MCEKKESTGSMEAAFPTSLNEREMVEVIRHFFKPEIADLRKADKNFALSVRWDGKFYDFFLKRNVQDSYMGTSHVLMAPHTPFAQSVARVLLSIFGGWYTADAKAYDPNTEFFSGKLNK